MTDMMIIENVKSSNVKSIGYDKDEETLQVRFNSEEIYHYFDVPEDVYETFKSAKSVGKWLVSNIKNKYKYSKI